MRSFQEIYNTVLVTDYMAITEEKFYAGFALNVSVVS